MYEQRQGYHKFQVKISTKVKMLQHLNREMKRILDFLHQKLIRPKDLANIMEIGIFIPGFLSSIFLRMSLHTSAP